MGLMPSMVAVGAVSDQRARLWLRTEVTGPFTATIWACGGMVRTALVADRRAPDADGTMAFTIPDDVPALGPLTPATAHGFRITVARTGEVVGEGRFETAPTEGTHGRVRHGTERLVVERLWGTYPGQRNPFSGLNVGVVHVEDEGAGAAVRFELLTCDMGEPDTARVAYASGRLSGGQFPR